MKNKTNKDTKENKNSDNDLMSGFIKIGIMNHYLNGFWEILIEDGFEVIANIYKVNGKHLREFSSELKAQMAKNEENTWNPFHFRALKVLQPDGSFFGLCGLRLDIFLQKKHQGVILTGFTLQKKEEGAYMSPHFILIIREGEEEKIKKSRIRAYRKLSKMKDIRPLIENKIIEDSLNPKKFPILKIDISNFQNQEFFHYYKELPI